MQKLTIGIMVKNQARELNECLSRLEKTRSEIKNEVIIFIDDATVDDTFNVARGYTQNVEYFKWIDDFSAIKNQILARATGEWCWILDADEFVCDTSPLINFLKSDEEKRYDFIQYFEKNFQNIDRSDYYIQYSTRIYKTSRRPRYIGKIHESVPVAREKVKLLEMYVDHVGYIGYDSSEKQKLRHKIMQNVYKENPKDLRAVVQYLETFSISNESEYNEGIKLLIDTLPIAREKYKDVFSGYVYFRLIRLLAHSKQLERAVFYTEEYVKLSKVDSYTLGEIYALLGRYFLQSGDCKKSAQYYIEYFLIYKKAAEKTLKEEDRELTFYNNLIINGEGYTRNLLSFIKIYSDGKVDFEAIQQANKIENMQEELKRFITFIANPICENINTITDGLENKTQKNVFFAGILYKVIKDKIDIKGILDKNLNEFIDAITLAAYINKECFLDYLKEYIYFFDTEETLQQLRFTTQLLKFACENLQMVGAEEVILKRVYLEKLSIYAVNTINPQIISEREYNTLPKDFAAGIAYSNAIEAKVHNDELGYIRELKNVARLEEGFAIVIKQEIENMHSDIKSENEIGDELDELIKNIKCMLNSFILQGDKENALMIYSKLLLVTPNDIELDNLKAKIDNI